MKLLRLLVGLTVLTLASTSDALACSCPSSGPPCQNAFQVDVVFAGTVRSVVPLPDDDLPPLRPGEMRIPRTVRVEFDTVVPFRGTPGSKVTVLTAGSGPACGYGFKPGERYLVYANSKGTELVTGTCSRTRPLSEAAEDLQFFKTLSAPSDRARLYGTVTHWEREVSTKEPRNYGPVPNLRVNVSGMGRVLDTWTDDAGRYDMKVPPGKYDVTFLPPPGFSNKYLQHSIELPDARACAVLDWSVRFDGRITGVLRRPQGAGAGAEIPVELMSADAIGKGGNISVLRTSSDSGGRFEFTEVPPGRYVVGVDLIRRMDAKEVFPTTFHPGTQDASRATIVELEGGQQRELDPMTLPPARRSHRLVGTVVFEDGTPASGAFISLSDGIATFRQVAVGIKTGPDGTFGFLVHEGLSYIARASFWDEDQRKQVAGTVGPFVIGDDVAPLRVVLSAQRRSQARTVAIGGGCSLFYIGAPRTHSCQQNRRARGERIRQLPIVVQGAGRRPRPAICVADVSAPLPERAPTAGPRRSAAQELCVWGRSRTFVIRHAKQYVRRPRRTEARPLADLSDFQPAEVSDFGPALTEAHASSLAARERRMVDQNIGSWNHIENWLSRVEALRAAA